MFEAVGVDGDVPLLRQILQHADMVEMAVGQDDGRRPGALAEAGGGGVADRRLRARNAGIDEDPVAIPAPEAPTNTTLARTRRR
ncbi:hypothetical protein GCM10025880_17360 [Methylorubrum aminovorans]|nr:hypothetical protein GCM10025880_17360 [Methylorubrum aminovorans]